MLIIRDVVGNEAPLRAKQVAITDNLGEINQLTFIVNDNDISTNGCKLIEPRSVVTVPETRQQFRITNATSSNLGNFKQYTITATHVASDLHDKYVKDTLTGSKSLDECMRLITKDTKFNYVIHDRFNNYAFSEEFGSGFADDLFINTLAHDFDFEWRFDNYTIHIYKVVGHSDAFIFVDSTNIAKITQTKDYSNIVTHITGTGKDPNENDDEDNKQPKKPIPYAEYTSPLADVYGRIDAEPVQDDRFTNNNSLLEYIKTKVTDQPQVQYTMDFINFSKGAPMADINDVSAGNYGWLRDRNGLDVEVRVSSRTYYPEEPELTAQVTFGTRKKTLTQIQNEERSRMKDLPRRLDNMIDNNRFNDLALMARLTGKVVGEVD